MFPVDVINSGGSGKQYYMNTVWMKEAEAIGS